MGQGICKCGEKVFDPKIVYISKERNKRKISVGENFEEAKQNSQNCSLNESSNKGNSIIRNFLYLFNNIIEIY